MAADGQLLSAAATGATAAATSALEEGADVNTGNAKGYTPLCVAAERGCVEIVDLLLRQPRVDTILCGSNGWTPLMWAARNGHVRVVERLCGHSSLDPLARLDATNANGSSALMIAATCGGTEIIGVLARAGAHLYARTGHSQSSALHLACSCGNAGAARRLLELDEEDELLGGTTAHGATALHLAAHAASAETLRCLLRAGANVHAQDKHQCTPLHYAVRSGDEQCVQLLRQAGAAIPSGISPAVSPPSREQGEQGAAAPTAAAAAAAPLTAAAGSAAPRSPAVPVTNGGGGGGGGEGGSAGEGAAALVAERAQQHAAEMLLLQRVYAQLSQLEVRHAELGKQVAMLRAASVEIDTRGRQAAARGEREAVALQARVVASEEKVHALGQQMELQLAVAEEDFDEAAAARRATADELCALRRRVGEVELVCTSLQSAMEREVHAAVEQLVPQAVAQAVQSAVQSAIAEALPAAVAAALPALLERAVAAAVPVAAAAATMRTTQIELAEYAEQLGAAAQEQLHELAARRALPMMPDEVNRRLDQCTELIEQNRLAILGCSLGGLQPLSGSSSLSHLLPPAVSPPAPAGRWQAAAAAVVEPKMKRRGSSGRIARTAAEADARAAAKAAKKAAAEASAATATAATAAIAATAAAAAVPPPPPPPPEAVRVATGHAALSPSTSPPSPRGMGRELMRREWEMVTASSSSLLPPPPLPTPTPTPTPPLPTPTPTPPGASSTHGVDDAPWGASSAADGSPGGSAVAAGPVGTVATPTAVESAINQMRDETLACTNGALPGVAPGEHSCSWELDWLTKLQRG